jgi:hypothetical protein
MSFGRGALDAPGLLVTDPVANIIAPTAIEKAIEVYKLFHSIRHARLLPCTFTD